ncbi:phosphocholine cytidylyltransferase family protein [Sphingomonas sp. SUN019]|uniref:phosphocholine cytidylyltransferase family protein n=1 Tax=Sphingomonas sp. SUN019 TaxID=2937788 RepID=UPI0021643964|nr:phosphocholine cytidylyltransferase family protein [Sphingomonas sp. SUN019]UVO50480.1 phosphocholine cytidylyltransferase family protein [Sphingomonas sp. SUN019]
MKAIIIVAGQGSRLLPLTLGVPKCLVPVGGRAILDHQLDAARAAGIDRAVVIGGYRIDQIAEYLSQRKHDVAVTLIFNPFWAVASSIGSVWAARDHLSDPFALMNGDTIFDPSIVAAAAADTTPGIRLVVDAIVEPEHDDMLVEVAGGRVCDVDKHLPAGRATHRSLGLVLSSGGDAYRSALREVIAGDEGIHAYHHAIIARLAPDGHVGAVVIDPRAHWQEIDTADDIARWERDHRQSDPVAA